MAEFKRNQGNLNGLRIIWLLFNGGTKALELIKNDIEKQRGPGSRLDVGYLENLGIHLAPHEREKVMSGEWDISLLVKYLQKALLSDDEPSQMQNLSDQSLMADIKRINDYRNIICHQSSISLSEQEFEKYWNECAAALSRLGISKNDIESIKSVQFSDQEQAFGEEKGTHLKGMKILYSQFIFTCHWLPRGGNRTPGITGKMW